MTNFLRLATAGSLLFALAGAANAGEIDYVFEASAPAAGIASAGIAADSVIAADASVQFDLAGWRFFDEFFDPSNDTITVDIGAAVGFTDMTVESIEINWTITTNVPSFLSEASVLFFNTPVTDFFFLEPICADPACDDSGTVNVTGTITLLDEFRLADGILWLHFYELFDDLPDGVDAFFESDSLTTVNVSRYVAAPVPAVPALIGLGLGLLALARRRA